MIPYNDVLGPDDNYDKLEQEVLGRIISLVVGGYKNWAEPASKSQPATLPAQWYLNMFSPRQALCLFRLPVWGSDLNQSLNSTFDDDDDGDSIW